MIDIIKGEDSGTKGSGEANESMAGKNFLARIYYKSPEMDMKKEEKEEERVPAVVLTDEEDDSDGEESTEDKTVEETPDPVPVPRKRYGEMMAEAEKEKEKEIELEKVEERKAPLGKRTPDSPAKHHHHHHRFHNVEHSTSPPGIPEIEKEKETKKEPLPSPPQVAKAEDDWDDVKIGAEPSSTSGSSGSSVDDSSGEWFYIDKKGVKQGPFQSNAINDWTVAGYLPMDLKVKHGENSKVYKSLGEVWTDVGIDKTFFEDEEDDSTGDDKRVEDIKMADILGPSPIKRRKEDESF